MKLNNYPQLLVHAANVATTTVRNPNQQPRALAFDDVVVLRSDGTSTIIKEHVFDNLVARGAFGPPSASSPSSQERDVPWPTVKRSPSSPSSSSGKQRRCDESTEIQVTSDTTFLNWDVAMSPVVSAAGGGVSVSVEDGYEIGNSLTVGSSVSTSLNDFISVSLEVDYSESWTSSQTSTLSFEVPAGQFGVVVSQPSVRRVVGNTISGCTDSPTTESFQSDTYSSQSYGELSWVQGFIRLCNSSSYPVPYCIGSGSHS